MRVPVNGAGLQILVVEDNADCALSTELLLRIHGNQVLIVGDGPTAVEKARTEKPDVVLLDIALPGLSGYDVAR